MPRQNDSQMLLQQKTLEDEMERAIRGSYCRTPCPFLNRCWRRVMRRMKKGKPTRGDSLECIKNDFVDMIECKYTKDRNGSDLVEID